MMKSHLGSRFILKIETRDRDVHYSSFSKIISRLLTCVRLFNYRMFKLMLTRVILLFVLTLSFASRSVKYTRVARVCNIDYHLWIYSPLLSPNVSFFMLEVRHFCDGYRVSICTFARITIGGYKLFQTTFFRVNLINYKFCD